MLRLSRDNDCFWVCDLPRRGSDAACQAVQKAAEKMGFLICTDEETKLWRIDLLLNDALFTENESTPLPIPQKEALHSIYGLYRMLASHPVPIQDQPMELIRSIVKLTVLPIKEQIPQVIQLTAQCAARLNRRLPLPSAAANALAQYIRKEDET